MKRILCVILTLCLLCMVPFTHAEVDYSSDYETALTLALNDLTNANGLETAIDILQRLGSYQLSKSYLQYLQPILDLTGDDANLESIRVLIGLCEHNTALVSDLEVRGFPACSEILVYVDARALEADGHYSAALERYASMFILDAPDRMQRAVGILMDRKPEVTVICRTEAGEELNSEVTEIERGSKRVFTAPAFEGYALTADSPDSVTVTVDALGSMDKQKVVFVYRKLPDTAAVTVICRTDTGNELSRETANVECGGSLTVEAKAFDGYELASDAAEKVEVFADNLGNLSQDEIVFTYQKIEQKVFVGDYVTFGHFAQTAAGNDNTPIEWLVLDVQDNKALLLSRHGMDAKPYNTRNTGVTWEDCTLRKWLNSEFINKAFTTRERAMIVLTDVDNSVKQGYSRLNSTGGNDTQDKIFLLSYAEANKYLEVTREDNKNIKSRTSPTAYAIRKGAFAAADKYTTEGTTAGWWWLRSPGDYQNYAAFVYLDGSLNFNFVHNGSGCVRPALWINLEADIF